MNALRCPICRRPHEEAKDLVGHILSEHPRSDTAANLLIEIAFVEMGVTVE